MLHHVPSHPRPQPQARRHSPHRAVGSRAHRGQVLVSLGHLPDGLVQLLPVERGPLLRHLPAAAARRRGGRAGAPACSRTLSSVPSRSPAADPTPRPRRCGGCDPRLLSAAAAPTSLGNEREPAARFDAAPAAVPLQPLPGERTPTLRDSRSRSSARSGSSGRDLPPSPQAAAGEALAGLSREQLREPRPYPIWNLPVGRGCARRARGTGRSREKRDAAPGAEAGTLGETVLPGAPRVGADRSVGRARLSVVGPANAWRRGGKPLGRRRGGKRAKRSLSSEPPAHRSRRFPRKICKSRLALSRKLLRSHPLKDAWLISGR